jgi:hypothetical protein
MNTPFAEPTPGALATLDQLLAANGIERRVIDGKLRINPTRGPLSEADVAFLRHFAEPLAEWVTNPPAPRVVKALTKVSQDCPHCGAGEDNHVFRIAADGGLQSRCVPCGCTWRWGNTADVVLAAGSRPGDHDADDGRAAP